MPAGWHDVAERQPRFVVFGELHGTEQGPRFVGSLACALAMHDERILVAIEQSATDNETLQTAWMAPRHEFAQALVGIGWAGRSDGVASEAMFDMISDLHTLKEQGLPIDIVAFNGMRDEEQYRRFADLPGQGPHEAAQAENIEDAASAGGYDRVLVLVGNFHARTQPLDSRGIVVDPMARRLSQYGEVVSLNMRYGDGTSWNCLLKQDVVTELGQPVRDEDIECGAHDTSGNAAFAREPFIEVYSTSGQQEAASYDGYFWVGPISASPPKVSDE
ncbi:hypothetical protein CP97_08150 [Aurantiacibacter atlanticus]|uniref:Haem-binding uptake Tiki superfamily ChaN domain-containing protein n=1 Tax=Aurantiacibacter atlanticus TaxID=1648404 RepID=A0A0H4VGP2_9SPHN|nr:hypothetical protein [Aurantiacibacter atlanticus]AKQ42001.2 hypothetical protein CP97_08150 [Aurantiacibacter atlanticus]